LGGGSFSRRDRKTLTQPEGNDRVLQPGCKNTSAEGEVEGGLIPGVSKKSAGATLRKREGGGDQATPN